MTKTNYGDVDESSIKDDEKDEASDDQTSEESVDEEGSNTEEAQDNSGESETTERDEESSHEGESDDDTDDTQSSESETEPEETERERKLRIQVENLNTALQKERTKNRGTVQETTTQKTQPTFQATAVNNDLQIAEERDAIKDLLKEFPDLRPENDPGDEKWKQFKTAFQSYVDAEVKNGGLKPVRYKDIISISRKIAKGFMELAPEVDVEKVKANRNKAKAVADAASMGTSTGGKRVVVDPISEKDKAAAALVGMSPESYKKHKNFYD